MFASRPAFLTEPLLQVCVAQRAAPGSGALLSRRSAGQSAAREVGRREVGSGSVQVIHGIRLVDGAQRAMETKQLRTFLTIIDTESFTRAGRRLGLSQSAISQQIGALERQLGVKLLRRTGTGARPSPAGEILVHYA